MNHIFVSKMLLQCIPNESIVYPLHSSGGLSWVADY